MCAYECMLYTYKISKNVRSLSPSDYDNLIKCETDFSFVKSENKSINQIAIKKLNLQNSN